MGFPRRLGAGRRRLTACRIASQCRLLRSATGPSIRGEIMVSRRLSREAGTSPQGFWRSSDETPECEAGDFAYRLAARKIHVLAGVILLFV